MQSLYHSLMNSNQKIPNRMNHHVDDTNDDENINHSNENDTTTTIETNTTKHTRIDLYNNNHNNNNNCYINSNFDEQQEQEQTLLIHNNHHHCEEATKEEPSPTTTAETTTTTTTAYAVEIPELSSFTSSKSLSDRVVIVNERSISSSISSHNYCCSTSNDSDHHHNNTKDIDTNVDIDNDNEEEDDYDYESDIDIEMIKRIKKQQNGSTFVTVSSSFSSSIVRNGCGLLVCFILVFVLSILYRQYNNTVFEDRTTNTIDNVVIMKKNSISSTPTSSSLQHKPQQKYHSIRPPPTTTTNEFIYPSNIQQLPDIVWFMSYPGSIGISNIIQYIEEISHTTTATNYGATLVSSLPTSSSSSSKEQFNTTTKNKTKTGTTKNRNTRNSLVDNDDSTSSDNDIYPIYAVHPDYQCGPYIHRTDLSLPSTTIITNTFCSISNIQQSSTVVCTECIPMYHKLLFYERSCATGNRIYENQYRSVQYDTHLPIQYIFFIQNPYHTFLNRLRITFQQKQIQIIQRQQYQQQKRTDNGSYQQKQQSLHPMQYDFFSQYTTFEPSDIKKKTTTKMKQSSISIIDYCHYLDSTYTILSTTSNSHTNDDIMDVVSILSNYTHLPCYTEWYKYIQWYNDAILLFDKYNLITTTNRIIDNNKIHTIYYETFISFIINQVKQQQLERNSRNNNCDDTKNNNSNYNDNVIQELFQFLNLTIKEDQNHKNNNDIISFLYESILYESSIFGNINFNEKDSTNTIYQWFSQSMLQDVAYMIYELSLPTTWEYIKHYFEPFLLYDTKHHQRHHRTSGTIIPPKHNKKINHPHLFKTKKESVVPSIPLSIVYDTNVPDDSIILNPLFDSHRSTTGNNQQQQDGDNNEDNNNNNKNGDYYNNHYEFNNPFHDLFLSPQEPNDNNPQVVWLLSFPNSGTSYTINNLEYTCNVTTGSNYAKDWDIVVPIRPELMNGPFIHNPALRIPHYVLTKTHCYGYCDDCGPTLYNITTNELFEHGCLRSERTNQTGSFYYENTVPVKAVHLYRNPFDNIVARMHLAVHKRERKGDDVSTFENSRDGLTAWCQYLDDKFYHEEQKFFSTNVLQLFQNVPCHADWYRYVQWHNHAYIMTERLNLSVYNLFYEDYTHNYDSTVQSLFQYLNVTSRQPSIDFYVGKSYEVFFTKQHAMNAAILVQSLSLPPVWEQLKQYFIPYM